MRIYVVTGANSGLGKEIVKALEALEGDKFVISVCGEGSEDQGSEHSHLIFYDLTDEVSNWSAAMWVKEFTEGVAPNGDYYPVLINCAGINYIDWFDQCDFSKFDDLMAINVRAGLQLIQNLIGRKPPMFEHETKDWFNGGGAILNIISNASHVPMTNSAFYNASKGAFHIATLSLARELRKTHGICIFGISPNKLSGTGMSKYIEERVPDLRGWSPEQAAQYQLSALPAGEETDPRILAEFIAYLLSDPIRHKYLTNTVLPYGA